MPWGGIISAAGSIGGSLLSHYSAKSINEDNMAFQREVAQNGVRWKVADMKAAGLNPLIASGINATAPAGGSSAMPDYSGIGASARDIGRMVAEKTSRIASANAAKASAEANNAIKTGQLIDQQKNNVAADTANKIADTAQKVKETSQIPGLSQIEVDNEFKKKNSSWLGALGRDALGVIQGFFDSVGDLSKSTVERAEKIAEQKIRSGLSAGAGSATSARSLPSDEEIKEMASDLVKKEAEKAARKTTNKGGVKSPTGRSVLY